MVNIYRQICSLLIHSLLQMLTGRPRVSKSLKAGFHLEIILIILEDILTVDSPKHDMIDASPTFCPLLSRHVWMFY